MRLLIVLAVLAVAGCGTDLKQYCSGPVEGVPFQVQLKICRKAGYLL